MKTLSEINEIHAEFAKRFGLEDRKDASQGSAAWFELKLGVISASCAEDAIAGKTTAKRATYMADLVAQICTGQFEEINSKYLDWGNQHEDAARALYEFENDTIVTELPFVFKDTSFRVGCSPDGFVSATKGMEIKCPYNPSNYVQFLTADKIKPEYKHQAQFTMWVLGASEWDMVQYHPLMAKHKTKTLTLARDEESMKVFDDLIPAFIHDMDVMLKSIGFEFGDQWKRIAEKAKLEAAS